MFDNDGGVDKFVGDEIVAFFFPLMSGPRHAAAAVDGRDRPAARDRPRGPGGPWVPVGAGVATGMAWVGAVGDEKRTDLTALGDTVNIAARLGGVARAGEVLMTGRDRRSAPASTRARAAQPRPQGQVERRPRSSA